MDKCFVIETMSASSGKFRMEFFGDRRFADARAAEEKAKKMAREKGGAARVSVRAVAFADR